MFYFLAVLCQIIMGYVSDIPYIGTMAMVIFAD